MLDALLQIVCLLRNVLVAVAWAGVELVNLLVRALGLMAQVLVGLLPAMPAHPAPLYTGILDWVNLMFPVGPVLVMFSTALALWTAFLLIRIPLRWVKAV